jgi:SAM-dependent methyltransferase
MSETAKYRHLTVIHCKGNVVDLGSQGDPVVPHAIQVELPDDEYLRYTSGQGLPVYAAYRGDACKLPFKDATLDTVYSSHLLEDFLDWDTVVWEWVRVLKPGGNLVILMPDTERWEAAIRDGQPPNCAHKRTGAVGALTKLAERLGNLLVLEDRLTNQFAGDYSILFVAQKTR